MRIAEEVARGLQPAIDRLVALEQGRQALVDALWAQIPSYAVHSAYLAAATDLDVNTDTTLWVKYTSWIATLPSNATGLLQIAGLTIPLGEGLSNAQCLIICPSAATRHLSSTVSGPMSLTLMGEVMPTYGAIT